jgi:orotidine-5'-phosphate decarboxylase
VKIKSRDRLILALDVPSAEEAKHLMSQVGPHVSFVKIGLELFSATGPDIVRWAVREGKQVFLDLKLLDIGETVRRTTAAVAALGASLLTVHASSKVLRAAVEGRGSSGMKIIAVTVLTNSAESDLEELGIQESMSDTVLRRGKLAIACGADGLVAGGSHVELLRMKLGTGPLIVTPGIRPTGSSPDDQINVMTPTRALKAGANYLVVGRPIRDAEDPGAAAQAIQAEIAGAHF